LTSVTPQGADLAAAQPAPGGQHHGRPVAGRDRLDELGDLFGCGRWPLGGLEVPGSGDGARVLRDGLVQDGDVEDRADEPVRLRGAARALAQAALLGVPGAHRRGADLRDRQIEKVAEV